MFITTQAWLYDCQFTYKLFQRHITNKFHYNWRTSFLLQNYDCQVISSHTEHMNHKTILHLSLMLEVEPLHKYQCETTVYTSVTLPLYTQVAQVYARCRRVKGWPIHPFFIFVQSEKVKCTGFAFLHALTHHTPNYTHSHTEPIIYRTLASSTFLRFFLLKYGKYLSNREQSSWRLFYCIHKKIKH